MNLFSTTIERTISNSSHVLIFVASIAFMMRFSSGNRTVFPLTKNGASVAEKFKKEVGRIAWQKTSISSRNSSFMVRTCPMGWSLHVVNSASVFCARCYSSGWCDIMLTRSISSTDYSATISCEAFCTF